MTERILLSLIAITAFFILRKKLHKMRSCGCNGCCCGLQGKEDLSGKEEFPGEKDENDEKR